MKVLRTHLPFLLLLILILAGGTAVFFNERNGTASYSDTDSAYNKAYWSERLAHEDAKAVYADFKKQNAQAPFSRQHFSAHVMGDAIYGAVGASGISLCDADFGFGCYHGFFARAIAEGGTPRIAELDAACVKAFGPLGTGCQHGIGHGILEYVGYQHVNDALALCGETTETVPLLGCATGVFMEYDAPLTGSSTALTPAPRNFDSANAYDPCPSVPAKYEDACYYQLGQFIAPGLAGTLQKLGAVCAGLPAAHRADCFLGAGEGLTYSAQYALPAALANCATFGGDDELSCRAGVSWALYADPAHRAQASAACAYADAAKTARCTALADLTQGKDGH